jgi:hypothetical protein
VAKLQSKPGKWFKQMSSVAYLHAGRCCWLALLVLLVTGLGSDAAFLQNQLPLEILLTTPSELLDNSTDSIKVEDGQAFMVSQCRAALEQVAAGSSCCSCHALALHPTCQTSMQQPVSRVMQTN